jgi:hypothetical protein
MTEPFDAANVLRHLAFSLYAGELRVVLQQRRWQLDFVSEQSLKLKRVDRSLSKVVIVRDGENLGRVLGNDFYSVSRRLQFIE